MSGLARLNELPAAEAVASLLQCCASRRWAEQMEARRPFESRAALLTDAEVVWWRLDEADWLEAFRGHPRIGERKAALSQTDREQRWSEGEQAGVATAGESTLRAIAEGNLRYEGTFGYIYLVCATGRTADEMLTLLRERLENDPAVEIRVAAGEQAKITRLRLEKLLDGDSSPPQRQT